MNEVQKFTEILAKHYGYKPLPQELSNGIREIYANDFDEGLLDKTFHSKIYSTAGTLIANKCSKIVIGDYGVYLELDDEDIIKENIKVKEGQEFRLNKDFKGKYHWYTPKDKSNTKLYYQTKGVSYADYLPNKWYVSPYEIMLEI